MNYENIVTRVTRSVSVDSDYVHNCILSKMKEGEKKSLILRLYNKASKLKYKIDNLLLNAIDDIALPGDLEKLCNLTDEHWEAVQELYMAIGQNEYDRMIKCSNDCVLSHEWRGSAEDVLEPFSRYLRG